jgi:predicted Zn-dependent protease
MRTRRCEAGRLGCTALLAAALLLPACTTLTVSEEQQLGYQFQQQMRREMPLLRDQLVASYVSEMGRELVEAAGPQPFVYHFYVVDAEEINAFAGPAGLIYVHTETILRASDASELAGVLAHEVGHVALRHIAENYGRQRGTRLGQNLLVLGASILGGGAVANAAALGSSLAAVSYLNRFGREAERESDDFAVEVMAKAGWDPSGLVSFFEMLLREPHTNVPTFLSSHPATDDRIEDTRAAIAELPSTAGLRRDDGGKFEIVKRRVELLSRRRY